jgi:hypothetical protein
VDNGCNLGKAFCVLVVSESNKSGGGGIMNKNHHGRKGVLKNLELFRARQRRTMTTANDELRQQQYRELQNILSPFWAWRSRSS